MKKLSLYIIPVQLFLAAYWLKNGFLDKIVGIFLGIIHPETAYYGLTWNGWHDRIVDSWDHSQIGHLFFSPFFDILFPIIIVLQCLPFLFIFISLINKEFITNTHRPWLIRSAVSSFIVTAIMLFSETLSNTKDAQYLLHLFSINMILIIYIHFIEKTVEK
ncbi:hypothetical protein [Photobacterium aquimaris]|uniref:Uncharacterized protein n=1 Tax=Photobacterium aquimaris TaxID=512643 RepID=A0A2T3HWP1_9GAMM|nr:hypothetical protein [Photobacterium aquimaris]MCP4956264.1 hypothetical protein [Photobacterium aquimaris]OBU22986.1 hypothetical protein AYY21_14210 [Photobacterium aquimaris]PQJ38751.1 hypothetical protein BTN98_15310 [Photobacterium aquimaris]PSU03343.1 hypothetical protein C0W81_12290 [Photobacterium aquimaris]